jgi:AcrR family transcriptional regulator
VADLPPRFAPSPVGRSQLSREALSEHQRERILAAATEVFAKRGYQASTVDNIAVAAKVAIGTFYAQFDGKEECLLESYERTITIARARIAAAVPADRPWARQALAVLQEVLALIAADPMQARLALVEIQTGGPTALARYGETLELAIAALTQGRASLRVESPPPETHEEAAIGGLSWLLAQRVLRGEAKAIVELFPQAAEIILEPYLGAARTKREIAAFARPEEKS